jgi:hypothetical protein
MRTTNKLKPALLDNSQAEKFYQVRIGLGNLRWAELNFSEKSWAQAEYNRIKGAGIYCQAWIETITIEEKTQ